MNIFEMWNEKEMRSTMQALRSENASLRREVRIKTIVYWTCLGGVVVLGLMKLYGEKIL